MPNHPTCNRPHRCPLPAGHSGLCTPTPIVEMHRKEPTVFDLRHFQPTTRGDWNKDVPPDVQRELMELAQEKQISLDYLCAIYRKGLVDGNAGMRRTLDEALNTGDGSYRP